MFLCGSSVHVSHLLLLSLMAGMGDAAAPALQATGPPQRGQGQTGDGAPGQAQQPAEAAREAPEEPRPKRQRTAAQCVKELQELKVLVDVGVVDPTEFAQLKARLLSGN